MNKTALKASFNSLSFSARFYGAMRRATKHYMAEVKNKKGITCLVIRYTVKTGFHFTDGNGKVYNRSEIYKLLRG